MKQDRPNTQVVMIDLQYFDSLNAFECWYGDHISYQEIEQRSYIEFKELMFSEICRDIKFRKDGRIGQVLTIKADMLKNEVEKFKSLLEYDKIKLTHNWIISNVVILKDGGPATLNKRPNEKNEDDYSGFSFDDSEEF